MTVVVDTSVLIDVLRGVPEAVEALRRARLAGRQWLPGNRGIDSADLAIAATALALEARLLTRNVKHFPMFNGLSSPY